MTRTCTRCVMDTSDPAITFDDAGVCRHCHAYDAAVRAHVRTGETAKRELAALVAEIKRAGAGKDHDCVIGVSGGVDSTYVAYAVKRLLGLRPIAVHLDNGWDSELAVKNIQNVLERLDVPLYTEVLDWEEFRDLQIAFLKASTPDSEIPTDHAIASVLYQMARKEGVRYILTGCNVRTESHLPLAWSQGHQDWRYISGLSAAFGTRPLRSYPHRSIWQIAIDQRRLRSIDVLDYLDYDKNDAKRLIERELGWRDYGGKHHESIYTRFYQGYILPRKFGFDKRRAHLSSLICSGQISREAALAELTQPPYSERQQREDREYVIKKFGMTEADFDAIMAAPPRRYDEYPSYANDPRLRVYRRVRGALGRLRQLAAR